MAQPDGGRAPTPSPEGPGGGPAKLGDAWPEVVYDGEQLDLVFTTVAGAPMLRQHVDRATRKAARRAGIDPTGLSTHAGRRSVVTSLYASGDLDLADVARFVGHSDTSTTKGYIQHEGERPRLVAERTLHVLDPAGHERSTPPIEEELRPGHA